MGIGVVDILDVDVFGSATDAIVCLDVNACCIEDINITGSNIDAQQQLSLNSAKDINIKAGYVCKTDFYFFVFRVMGIGVVDILDVDVFGGATDAIVCLDVNACCINVVISLTANDKHSNDKHADNNLTNQSDNNPANQPSNNPTNQASNNPANQSDSNPTNQPDNNPTNPPQASARLTFTFLCLE
jgi:hypothetical protein